MNAFSNEDSTYFMHTSELAEIARLLNQDRLVTAVVSLLPAGVESAALHTVLDIGAGPGGWLLDLVATYPSITGVGLDISKNMIRYANHLKQAEGKAEDALTFLLMDARQPLAFPDAHFDFIQMRLCHSFLRPAIWPSLLRECYRVLRPGGVLRVTDLEIAISNKLYTEEYFTLMPLVWTKGKLSFSPIGRSIGILPALPPLLSQAGFEDRQTELHAIDASKDSPYYTLAKENTLTIFAGVKDIYEQIGGYSSDYLLGLKDKFLREMDEDDFACFAILFSIYSKKSIKEEIKGKRE